MTDPAPSTDPATPPADPATPPADPANPPVDPPANDPADPTEDARVARANREAANYRTQLRAAQDQLTKQGETLAALAAVFNPGSNETDPAAQLAAITGEAEGLRSEVTSLRAEVLVHNLSPEHGANPVALLDSRGFMTTLTGLDPAAADYRDQVASAIKDAVAKNPNYAAQGQVPSRGGAPSAGQGAGQPDGAVTQEQFNAMGYTQRAELFSTNPDLYRRLAG
jgi:hypothetical protein